MPKKSVAPRPVGVTDKTDRFQRRSPPGRCFSAVQAPRLTRQPREGTALGTARFSYAIMGGTLRDHILHHDLDVIVEGKAMSSNRMKSRVM
jgi:hypothetical protein